MSQKRKIAYTFLQKYPFEDLEYNKGHLKKRWKMTLFILEIPWCLAEIKARCLEVNKTNFKLD